MRVPERYPWGSGGGLMGPKTPTPVKVFLTLALGSIAALLTHGVLSGSLADAVRWLIAP